MPPSPAFGWFQPPRRSHTHRHCQMGDNMSLKHLFHRRTKATGISSPEPAGTCEATPLAPSEDLQEAWAELTEPPRVLRR